jgi:hypothetical protein
MNRIKVGIMCEGFRLARWQKACIENLQKLGGVEISLLIVDASAQKKTSLLQKIKRSKTRRLFFIIYSRYFNRPKSVQKEDMSEELKNVPVIQCATLNRGKYSQYFSAEDVNNIRSYQLDFILRFGFNIIRGEILLSARYGVWSFHHDDEQKYRGGPPCFWEIYRSDPETGSILQRLTEKLDAGIILKKGIFRTKSFSYAKNIDQAYFESAKWPGLVCKDILNGNADYLDDEACFTNAPIFRYPNNRQVIRFLLLVSINSLKKVWERFFVMQYWNVALVRSNFDSFLKDPSKHSFIFLRHRNKASFNADCFGIDVKGDVYVFFEELNYKSDGIGRLMWTRIGDIAEEAIPEEIKIPDVYKHASYPFLYKEGGALYLIPETAVLKEAAVYECSRFPTEWKKKAVLLSGDFISDSTLFKHNQKYWLFFTIHSDEYDSDMHLHIAFAETLDGPFRMHPQNPVKISARSARPAGAIFVNESGELIRPAQNFCRTYGGSIVFNKIEVLDENRFKEREIDELKPFHPFYKHGVHTLNILNDHSFLIDMKRHTLRFKMDKKL